MCGGQRQDRNSAKLREGAMIEPCHVQPIPLRRLFRGREQGVVPQLTGRRYKKIAKGMLMVFDAKGAFQRVKLKAHGWRNATAEGLEQKIGQDRVIAHRLWEPVKRTAVYAEINLILQGGGECCRSIR